jgi:hypothetical protein
MSLVHLVYASSALHLFGENELLALLGKSRRNNAVAGITGLLLYRAGNFIQVLEGEETAVAETHARIAADLRHNGLIVLIRAPIAERSFGDWSMGFRNILSDTLHEVPGYSDFLNQDWDGAALREAPDRALLLLHLFRRNMR